VRRDARDDPDDDEDDVEPDADDEGAREPIRRRVMVMAATPVVMIVAARHRAD
jgi:hypothetical protein